MGNTNKEMSRREMLVAGFSAAIAFGGVSFGTAKLIGGSFSAEDGDRVETFQILLPKRYIYILSL